MQFNAERSAQIYIEEKKQQIYNDMAPGRRLSSPASSKQQKYILLKIVISTFWTENDELRR